MRFASLGAQATAVHWPAWEREGERIDAATKYLTSRWQNSTHCTFKSLRTVMFTVSAGAAALTSVPSGCRWSECPDRTSALKVTVTSCDAVQSWLQKGLRSCCLQPLCCLIFSLVESRATSSFKLGALAHFCAWWQSHVQSKQITCNMQTTYQRAQAV